MSEHDKWLPSELVQVADVVKVDVEIAALDEIIETEGRFIPDRFGAPKAHPAVAMRERMYHRRAALTRVLGLVADGIRAGDKKTARDEANGNHQTTMTACWRRYRLTPQIHPPSRGPIHDANV
jgi:hypothetical protein